ncbi:sce7726 family protein [Caulobacter sp. LARHSG274]
MEIPRISGTTTNDRGRTQRRPLPSTRLSEADIKAALLTELRRRGSISAKTVVANEFRVGKTSVRADLALLGDRLTAVEIKSDADTLKRLERQVAAYSLYFDELILVLARRHLARVSPDLLAKAQVWIVELDGTLSQSSVPGDESLRSRPLADLLTKKESRRYLGTEAGDAADHYDAFVAAFRRRFGPTSEVFWRSVSRRRVKAEDLHALSRYRDQRLAFQKSEQRRVEQWSQWEVAAAALEAA